MLGYQFAHQVNGAFHVVVRLTSFLLAEEALGQRHHQPEGSHGKPCIAAGSSEADDLAFQHDHVQRRLGFLQKIRRRDPRVAATDDDHITFQVTAQRRVLLVRPRVGEPKTLACIIFRHAFLLFWNYILISIQSRLAFCG